MQRLDQRGRLPGFGRIFRLAGCGSVGRFELRTVRTDVSRRLHLSFSCFRRSPTMRNADNADFRVGWGASGKLLKVCRSFRLQGAHSRSFASFSDCNDSSMKMPFVCWRYLFETIGCGARLTSDRLNAVELDCESDSRLSAAMTFSLAERWQSRP